MKHLYYVRHGETEMNVAGIWSGQIETPLTETGKQQARATGKHIKDNHPPIDAVVCSTLSRTLHTAQIICEEIGFPPEQIQQSALLVERHFGELEGTPTEDFKSGKLSFVDLDDVPDSETVAQMHERAMAVLEFIKSLPQDNVLVVSHGTFGRALRRVVEQLPHHREYDEAHRQAYRLNNAELIQLI